MKQPCAHDVIVARATASGRGAVAVVRLSGPGAGPVARAMTGGRRLPPPRQLARVCLRENGVVVDHGLWVFFPAPRSFTGEDVVEFHLHGNPLLVARVCELAAVHGARHAKPGEFTRRAVQHGKLSLSQAEGLGLLIDAPSAAAMTQAAAQLGGRLSERFARLEQTLLGLIAAFEAGQDYPEEGVQSAPQPVSNEQLAALVAQVRALLATHPAHQSLHHLPRVAIVGRPNAGKSSLLNRLLGSDRAITSDTPGTTRDIITATLNLGGQLVELMDTAGLRQAADSIEGEGVRRAGEAAKAADLCLLLADLSLPAEAVKEDRQMLRALGVERLICVGNKADLCASTNLPRGVQAAISCKTAEGVDHLLALLASALAPQQATAAHAAEVAVNDRHARNLQDALQALTQAQALLGQNAPGEVVADCLWQALRAVQLIEGEGVTERMLDEMFSRFCLGK